MLPTPSFHVETIRRSSLIFSTRLAVVSCEALPWHVSCCLCLLLYRAFAFGRPLYLSYASTCCSDTSRGSTETKTSAYLHVSHLTDHLAGVYILAHSQLCSHRHPGSLRGDCPRRNRTGSKADMIW